MIVLPILLKDGYKCSHYNQYPPGTTKVYSNMTPRKSRVPGVDFIIPFGLQYFLKEYLTRQFDENFFTESLDVVMRQYKRRINNYLGPNAITFDHIEDLHRLGYLPLHIKAIPEGLMVPSRVPWFTVTNTLPKFFWLTNMLETLMSNVLWEASTSATTSFLYRRCFEYYANATGADKAFVKWQGHDFSFRGMAGIEAAMLSGAAHLLSFTGTDTIPAIDLLEQFYGADSDREVVGGSIPATEHSVVQMGGKGNEFETVRRLITEVCPEGPISYVSDTWDFWGLLTGVLPALREEIMRRNGKLVVRPDSGDPVKIICGDLEAEAGTPQRHGAIEVLWDRFGGTVNKAGFRELDPHIGLIYGDSITLDRQDEILRRLQNKCFASSNVVLGIGSFTYQFVTRDTYGFAMKATYGEHNGVGVSLFKDPLTDDGTKKSAKGLLRVNMVNGKLELEEDVSPLAETGGMLETVFLEGELQNQQTLAQIRARIEAQL